MSNKNKTRSTKALTPGPGQYEHKYEFDVPDKKSKVRGVTILERHKLAAVLKEKLVAALPGP